MNLHKYISKSELNQLTSFDKLFKFQKTSQFRRLEYMSCSQSKNGVYFQSLFFFFFFKLRNKQSPILIRGKRNIYFHY